MTGIRARGLPPIAGFSTSEEQNVRTYVTYGGKPGVYFFSLDAVNLAAVLAARTFYHLPYFHALMKAEENKGMIPTSHVVGARLPNSAGDMVQ